MKTKRTISFLLAFLIAGSISAHAGGLIEMITGGGKDRGPQTNGKVTVNGLSKYEGKFVMGIADSDPALLAAGNITSEGVISAGAIKGGKAALKVWQGGGGAYGSFDWDLADTLVLSIYDGEEATNASAMGFVEVAFKKGKGSGTGAFIATNAFGGAMGRIANDAFAGTIANSNASAIAAANAAAIAAASGEASSGGLFSRLFGGGKDKKEPVASDGSGGGLFSRLFGGGKKSAAGGSVDELKARALAGDAAALQELGVLARDGNRDALNAMTEIVATGAISGGFNFDELLSGGSASSGNTSRAASVGGMKWTLVEDRAFGNGVDTIAYGNGKFIAGYVNHLAYSSDGIRWTVAEKSDVIDGINAIAYGNNRWVAGEYNGGMAYSGDGVTWTSASGGVGTANAIAYGNNRWVAVADWSEVVYSEDGEKWTDVSDRSPFRTSDGSSADIKGVAYGNGKWVAVGGYNTTAGNPRTAIAYSSDGINWTRVADTSAFNASMYGIQYEAIINAIAYGNNRFVAAGQMGIAYSSDGEKWTLVADAPSGSIYSIAYGNNRFVAVGYDGFMAYSADGIRWTKIEDNPFRDTIYSIAFGNNRFVAVSGGRVAYSD